MRINLSTYNWFMFGLQDYILPWKLTLIRERSKKENEFRLSFDRSVYCLYWFQLYLTSNTFAKLYDSDHIICADKAAPLKHCRIKVKSYSSALTVFPFSRSKVSQLFVRGYPVRMRMDDQVMLFSHEAGDMGCRSWSLNGELVLQYFLPEKQQIRKHWGYNNPNQINLQHAKSCNDDVMFYTWWLDYDVQFAVDSCFSFWGKQV